MTEKYEVAFVCSNCGLIYDVEFDFGTVAVHGPCRKCGVTREQVRQAGMRNSLSPQALTDIEKFGTGKV